MKSLILTALVATALLAGCTTPRESTNGNTTSCDNYTTTQYGGNGASGVGNGTGSTPTPTDDTNRSSCLDNSTMQTNSSI